MNIKLPSPLDKWDARFQSMFTGAIERAFALLNPSASVPSGGAVGNVLIKNTARDYDTAWSQQILPTHAGAPSSPPTGVPAGYVATLYDTTNNKLYVYNGAWKSVLLT